MRGGGAKTMKRSSQVGLAIMGVAAFGATYASVAAYRASPAPMSSQPAAAAQTCTTRPDGTQNCEPARRGFAYYLLPSFMFGSASHTSSAQKPQGAAFASHAPVPTHGSVAAPPPPAAKVQPTALTTSVPPAAKVQPAALTASAPAAAPKPAALTYTARPTTPAVSSSGAQRGGFGTTAQSNVRVSAGG